VIACAAALMGVGCAGMMFGPAHSRWTEACAFLTVASIVFISVAALSGLN